MADGIAVGRPGQLPFSIISELVDDVVTVHHGHMPEIDVTSPTTATGTWAMEDTLRWHEGSPLQTMHGYGH